MLNRPFNSVNVVKWSEMKWNENEKVTVLFGEPKNAVNVKSGRKSFESIEYSDFEPVSEFLCAKGDNWTEPS